MRLLRICLGIALVAAAAFGGLRLTGSLVAATQNDPGGQSRERGILTVQTVPAEMMSFKDTVEAVGTIRARLSVELHPTASGEVSEIAFSSGDQVNRGDTLMRLDDAAERAALKSAEATLVEARNAFDRQERLSQSGTTSDAALETARAAYLRAEAERDRAMAALNDRTIRAPFAGIVGFTDLAPGQLVGSETIVTTLDDLSVVEVEFRAPERVLARLEQGLIVELTSAAYPDRRFTGKITAIDTRVDQATRSIALRAEIQNEDRSLTSGMFMQTSLVLGTRRSIAVPERSLTVSAGQVFVYMVDEETARKVAVNTGATREGFIEVTGDLDEGAEVVVSNLQSIQDGAKVQIDVPRQAASSSVSPE